MKKVKENENDKKNLTPEQQLFAARKKAKRAKTIRRIVIWTILIIAVLYGLFAYNFHLQNSRWPWQPEAVSTGSEIVRTKVYLDTYTTDVDISGYVSAYQTQDVMIRSTGAVKGVYVKEGDRVVKGQLLAETDSTSQSLNVREIEWQIEKARINGNTSDRDMEILQMRLDNAKQQLENTKAYALFDGVVVKVSIKEGDYFEAGKAVITIIDDSKYKSTVEVDEIDVQLLKTGMKAVMTADSIPGVSFEGYVSYIPMIGRYTNTGIGVMDVEVVIETPPEKLKPGFSFEGVIEVESEQSMLLVSQSAVTTRRGVSTVTKELSDGSTETVTVQVKYLGENLYQILSGDVKDGDTVVYSRSEGGLAGLFTGGMDMMTRR